MNDMSLWVRDTLLMIMFAKGIIRITNGNQYLRDMGYWIPDRCENCSNKREKEKNGERWKGAVSLGNYTKNHRLLQSSLLVGFTTLSLLYPPLSLPSWLFNFNFQIFSPCSFGLCNIFNLLYGYMSHTTETFYIFERAK